MQAQQKYLSVRWVDVIDRSADTRTPDEIAADIFKRAGLTLAGGGAV